MRSPRIPPVGYLLALTCLALSGCVGEEPTSAASPTVTNTSLFASNDETLAAAVAAFQRYLDVQNAVASDPSLSLGVFDDVTIDPLLSVEINGATKQRDSGLLRTGQVKVDSPILEYSEYQPDGRLLVRAFVCLDMTDTRILDAQNSDVTPASRDDRVELHVFAFTKTAGSSDLIMGRSELWQYDGRC
ncbi:hypothetical protein HQQ81_13280 [Microbacteriaceae bacterium VKM Ac-2854]|nr:hypothetical protein [Microbacteriaceae bacterium VKM Ac-2854]